MKKIKTQILIILVIMLLTSCQSIDNITIEAIDGVKALANTENSQSSIIATFYDYGTVECGCGEPPEAYQDLVEKYKGKIHFEFVSYFDAPEKYRQRMPLQILFDAERNEIATHEGKITTQEIVDIVDEFLGE